MMTERDFLIAFNSAAGAYEAETGGGSLAPWGYTHLETWQDAATGFKARAYVDEAGNYILAFAGTEDLQDAYQDLANFGVGQWDENEPVLLNAFRGFASRIAPINSIQFTGHSLGGALAQYAAYDFVTEGVITADKALLTTFNALGGELGLISKYPATYNSNLLATGNIHHYFDPSDLVSMLSPHLGGQSANYQLRASTDPIFTLDAHLMTTIQTYFGNGLMTGLQASHDYFEIDEIVPALQMLGGAANGWVSGGASEVNDVEAAARVLSMVALIPRLLDHQAASAQWDAFKAFLIDNLVMTTLAPKMGIASDEGIAALKLAVDLSIKGLGSLITHKNNQGWIQAGAGVTAFFAEVYDWLSGGPDIDPSDKALTYSILNYLVGATLTINEAGSFDQKISEDMATEIFDAAHNVDDATFPKLLEIIGGLLGRELDGSYLNAIQLANDIVEQGITLAGDLVPAARYTEASILELVRTDTLDGRLMRYTVLNQLPFVLENVSSEFFASSILNDPRYALSDETDQYWQDRVTMLQLVLERNQADLPSTEPIPIASDESILYDDVATSTHVLTGDDDVPSMIKFGSEAEDPALAGSSRDDRLYGRGGDDTLTGNAGRDHLEGNAGNDTLYGDAGTDSLYGGAGDDQLHGGAGTDFLIGGDGNDTYHYQSGDGDDFIDDIDPGDRLVINGHTVTNLRQAFDGVDNQYFDDRHNLYTLDATGALTISIFDDFIQGWDGLITIDNFDRSQNHFGFQFGDAEPVDAPDMGGALVADPDTVDFIYQDRAEIPEQASFNSRAIDYDAANYYLSSYQDDGFLFYFQGGDAGDSLQGGAYSDQLFGMNGDDYLFGGFSSTNGELPDFLYGGMGSDVIEGGDGVNYMWGNEERAFIEDYTSPMRVHVLAPMPFQRVFIDPYQAEAEDSVDQILGGTTHDYIDGGEGNDALFGAGDEDWLVGGVGSDRMFGGAGNDFLIGEGYLRRFRFADHQSAGLDYLLAADVVAEATYNDLLDGGEGDDRILGDIGNDTIFGGDGADRIDGDRHNRESQFQIYTAAYQRLDPSLHGHDTIFGGKGEDELVGNGGDDCINGGADHDMIWGDDALSLLAGDFHGKDTLDGGVGDDQVAGGGNDDIVLGGEGNDLLFGDNSHEPETDVPGTTLDGRHHGNDQVEGGNGDDQIIGGGGHDILTGGAGDDLIHGDVYDSYGLASEFHGADVIEGGAGADRLFGDGGNDVISGGTENDVLYGDNNSTDESTHGDDTLSGDSGNDIIYGNGGNDTIKGDAGDDTIYGNGGNDTIIGCAGVDYMDGGSGNDTYVFNTGDGAASATNTSDTIADSAGMDRVLLNGVDISGIVTTVTSSGDVKVSNGSDGFWVLNGYGNAIETFVVGDKSLSFAELLMDTGATSLTRNASTYGANLYGGAVSDTLSATQGGASFFGGKGNDQLTASNYENTFLYRLGDGSDLFNFNNLSIAPTAPTPIANKIVFDTSAKVEDLSLTVENGRLVLVFDQNNRISIDNFSEGQASNFSAIGEFVFADQSLSFSSLLSKGFDLAAGTGNTNVVGTSVTDRITGSSGINTLRGGLGDDEIMAGDGNDYLYGGEGNDVLKGEMGVDWLYGENGSDHLYAGNNGNDRLYGGAGTDHYYVANDTQNVTIYDDQYQIHIEGAASDPANFVIFKDSNNRLVIYPKDGQEIVLHDYFTAPSSSSAADITFFINGSTTPVTLTGQSILDRVFSGTEQDDVIRGISNWDNTLFGNGGNDSLIGGRLTDRLYGGAGNDTLNGGDGNNQYLFGRGDGSDTIVYSTDTTSGKLNVLSFRSDVTPSEIIASRNGYDLVLSIADSSDRVTVQRFFFNDTIGHLNSPVQLIQFSDGTTWLPDFVLAKVLAGTTENDVITGTVNSDTITGGAGNDTLYGRNGNDILDGGSGNDVLRGDAGDDTYLFGFGDGSDQITETGSAEIGVLRFKQGVLPEHVSVSVSFVGNSHHLNVFLTHPFNPSLSSMVRINNYLDSDNSLIDVIEFTDSAEIWSVSDVMAKVFAQVDHSGSTVFGHSGQDEIIGLSGRDFIYGLNGADQLIGGQGDDRIFGGEGGDALLGSEGNDELYGGLGGDYLEGGSGDDKLYGYDTDNTSETGNDVLHGNSGNDSLFGGSGNDYLSGGAGDDSLGGGSGNDTYYFDLADGDDVISDSSGTGDRILLGPGITESDILLFKQTNSLYLVYAPTNKLLISVTSHFSNGAVEYIEFSNNSAIWDAASIQNNVIDLNGVANAFVGTAGDDQYLIDHWSDTIAEVVNGGVDSVVTDRSYTLPSNVENLTLTGVFNQSATGNELANILVGNSGNNRINGGSTTSSDRDIAYGGAGNDYYINVETIHEYLNEGIDTVEVSGPSNGQLAYHVENMVITSNYMYLQTWHGNDLDNVISNFNRAGETLMGYGGNDTLIADRSAFSRHNNLFGHDGNDTLWAADEWGHVLSGGADDDTYHVKARTGGVIRDVSGFDVLVFDNSVGVNDVAVTVDGNDLYISSGGGIGLRIEYGAVSDVIDQFNFVDRSLSWSQVMQNSSPVVNMGIDRYWMMEDSAISLSIPVQAFADFDGDTLSYIVEDMPEWLNFDGTNFIGTPSNSGVGTTSITVVASDGQSSVSTSFNLTVANTNDAPIVNLALPDISVNELEEWSFTIPAGSFSDVDVGDQLSFNASLSDGAALPDWLTFNSDTLIFTRAPDSVYQGVLSLLVLATDSSGESVSDTFNVDFNSNNNHAPNVNQGISARTIAEDASFTLVIPADAFADLDGDALTYSVETLPDWLSFNGTTFSGNPINAHVGSTSITVTASDGLTSVSTNFTLTVTNTNDAPVLSLALADQSVGEREALSFGIPTGSFTDVDAGDSLSFSASLTNGSPLPTWLTFNAATQTFSGTPSAVDIGVLNLMITATDSAGASASNTFEVTILNVNDAPVVVQGMTNSSTAEDASFTLVIPADAFTDLDGDSLTYTVSTLPSWLSFNGTAFTGTPANGDVGNATITVTASDGEASVSTHFTLTVTNANDAPVVTMVLADRTVDEREPMSFGISLGSFSDVDMGDHLSYSASRADGSPLPAWLSFNAATQTFSGTPSAVDIGVLSLMITATDSAGASASDTFEVTILNVNDAPVVDQGMAHCRAAEDSAFTLTIPTNAFADLDGDMLTYSVGALLAWLSFDGTVFSGTPSNMDVGSVVITVIASDGQASVSADFVLNVTNSNDAPIVSMTLANQTGTEGAPLSFSLPAESFTDIDVGDSLTYSASLADGSPLPAWLSFSPATRTFSGTPGASNVGNLNLMLTATDLAGASASTMLMLTVTAITPIYDSIVTGTSTGNTLTGTTGRDLLDGLAGNDTLYALAGDDRILGGAGNDTLYGGAGNDEFVIEGQGQGWDRFYGEDGVDTILGGVGDDTISITLFDLASSIERIDGGAGVNVIAGTTSSNTLDFSAAALIGIDRIDGGAGNDMITGSTGDDTIIGGVGNDTLRGQAGEDRIIGGAGNDTLYGGVGNDEFIVEGVGQGSDRFYGEEGVDTILGGVGDDTIIITLFDVASSIERIDGGAGVNVIAGTTSGNTLDFSATTLVGVDRIEGAAGNDTITGSSGNDTIVGGLGNDTLYGGNGNDEFVVEGVGQGLDRMYGGEGVDMILGGVGDDTIMLTRLDLAASIEHIDGGSGINVISGTTSGNVLDFSATTMSNIAWIDGGSGNDIITGSAGTDNILGSAGADTLRGGAGDDQLTGGIGNDTLDGGLGSDLYCFGPGMGADLIQNQDADLASIDIARFEGVAVDDLWFSRSGNNLQLTLAGTVDRVTVSNWYASPDNQLDRIEVGSSYLLNSQVDQLVAAMSVFAVPSGTGNVIPQSVKDTLQPVLAATWQAA